VPEFTNNVGTRRVILASSILRTHRCWAPL
jgi:hypothetical protein